MHRASSASLKGRQKRRLVGFLSGIASFRPEVFFLLEAACSDPNIDLQRRSERFMRVLASAVLL